MKQPERAPSPQLPKGLRAVFLRYFLWPEYAASQIVVRVLTQAPLL